MARRRRGGANLNDLKSRLGAEDPKEDPIRAALNKQPSPAEPAVDPIRAALNKQPAPAEPVVDPIRAALNKQSATAEPVVDPIRAALTKPVETESTKSEELSDLVPDFDPTKIELPEEDFTNVVAEEEKDFEYDPNAVDPSIQKPGSKIPWAVLVTGVLAGVGSLIFGYIASGVMQTRQLVNQQIAEAIEMNDAVKNIAGSLIRLNSDLGAITLSGYSSSFDDSVNQIFSGGERPVLDMSYVTSSRALITYNQDLSRQIMQYATATNYLGTLVDRHVRMTQREMPAIEEILNPSEDDANQNYAIVFKFEEHIARYNAFLEDSEANPFVPLFGLRVSYEDLQMTDIPEEIAADEDALANYNRTFGITLTIEEANVYNQMFEPIQNPEVEIPIYNFLLLDRDMIVTNDNAETAIDRYVRRASQIQDQVEILVEQQALFRTDLETLADKKTVFTL